MFFSGFSSDEVDRGCESVHDRVCGEDNSRRVWWCRRRAMTAWQDVSLHVCDMVCAALVVVSILPLRWTARSGRFRNHLVGFTNCFSRYDRALRSE